MTFERNVALPCQMIVLKVTFHDGSQTEIKRLPMSRLPNELTFDELVVIINRMFKRSDQLVLKYLDEDISHALNLNTTFKIHAFTDKIKDIPTKPELLLNQKTHDSPELREMLENLQTSLAKLLSKVETDVKVQAEKKESLAPVNYSQFETTSQPGATFNYQNSQPVAQTPIQPIQTPIQPIQTPITQQGQIQPQMNQQMNQTLAQHVQQSQINPQGMNQPLNQQSQMNQIHQSTPPPQQSQSTLSTSQAYSQWSPQDSNYQQQYYQTQQRGRPFSEKKQLRLYMHPPSIPTRFQTIHYDDSEKKAFSSTTRRFEGKTNDLPGPGYYAKAAEKLELVLKDASISKKGYGVGFASQQKRFLKPPTDLETDITISPAQYFPKSPKYSESLQNSLSAAFRNPTNAIPGKTVFVSSNTMVRTKRGFKPTPGPGEYSVEPTTVRPPLGNEKSSIFKSKTERGSLGANMNLPAPGSYDIAKSCKSMEPKVYGAISSFRSSERFQNSYLYSSINYRTKRPGPTSYNITDTGPSKKPARKIKIVNIADPPPLPEEPLSNQVCIPGSGKTPIAFPSPGKYNIVRGADATHKSSPTTRSIFMSKSERFAQPFNKDHSLTPNPDPITLILKKIGHNIIDLIYRPFEKEAIQFPLSLLHAANTGTI
ncbi:hypothetical protein HDV04_003981 [Boothiomyces sp. JEL0838]|nr:hypothetical protein HDV04_003981 [Boothiomyces sp. JEL0838]